MTDRKEPMGETLCALRGHGDMAGNEDEIGGMRWCLRCGRTWRDTYDGIEVSWVRIHGVKFGAPTERNL